MTNDASGRVADSRVADSNTADSKVADNRAGDGSATDNRTAWQPWLEELQERRQSARAMGGPERVEKYMHSRNKLSARQRLEALFDDGTFVELGTMVGSQEGIPADAFICGYGLINNRPAYSGAEDFTVMGGSIGAGNTAKRYRIAELAGKNSTPLVMMLEGAGHRLTDTGGSRAPNDLLALADLGGQVPMVCLIMGAAAGHSAITAPLSNFTIMTSYASMFTGGPPLVKSATGEEVTKEELGGPQVCVAAAGTVHNVARTDEDALAMARRYLSYMPQSSTSSVPRVDGPDTAPREVPELLDIIPPNDRRPYDMGEVLRSIVDESTFFEVQPDYGVSLICGLARLGGEAVAIVANNPTHLAGALTSEAAIKGTDFLETVSSFGHPVIFLADNPGVMAGTKAEKSGILRWAGQMFKTQRRMSNTKIQVTMRKAFGFGAVTMAQNPFDNQSMTFSLPSVNMAAMPADSGGRSAKLDTETQERVETEQRSGPYRLANRLGCDEVIAPQELRNALLSAVQISATR